VQRVRAEGDPVIKAMTKPGANGRRMLFLGVDDENVVRLVSNEPIRVSGEDFGVDFDILIVHGKTYARLFSDMRAAGFEIPNVDLDKPFRLYGDELQGKKNS
jgi:hypothetical protein